MILGSYPCCDHHLMLDTEGRRGFYKHQCEHCGTWCWTKLSSIDPQTWIESAFLELYEVDEDTKRIKLKGERETTPEDDERQRKLIADLYGLQAEAFAVTLADELYNSYRRTGFMSKYLAKTKTNTKEKVDDNRSIRSSGSQPNRSQRRAKAPAHEPHNRHGYPLPRNGRRWPVR